MIRIQNVKGSLDRLAVVERFAAKRDLVDIRIPSGDIVGIGITSGKEDAPHDAAVVLNVEGVERGRLFVRPPSQSIHAVLPLRVEGIPGRLVDESVPPGIIDRCRALNLGVDPPVPQRRTSQGYDEPVLATPLVGAVNGPSHAGDEHSSIGFLGKEGRLVLEMRVLRNASHEPRQNLHRRRKTDLFSNARRP